MAQAEIRSRADELEVAFERRARANGRTFAQEVEELLKSNAPFSPEERVAVKWFVAETDFLVADDLSASNHRLFAPRLIMTKVANTLARKAMAGLMSAAEAGVYLRSLPHYFGGLLAVDELIEPALKNACAIRHPIYDQIYLEAARRLDAQLVTADRRFIAKIAGTDFARHVMLFSDWRPE